MKQLITYCLIILNSAFGYSQIAEFDFLGSTTHTWDKTNEGEVLEHYFVFKNTGDAPLIIENAEVSCDCTTVEFPDYPIFPQASDSILVKFNTNQTYYNQNRRIVLKANTKKDTRLRIKTYVIPKDEQ